MAYLASLQPRPAARLIDTLSDAELLAHLDYLAGSARVLSLGWRVSERRACRERYAERNQLIRERHAAGETYGQLAGAFGLSRGRLCQICNAQKSVYTQEM